MTKAKPGTVYLVGAGPGDPELLTLKAGALLRSADLVLHDDLIPPQILALAGPLTKVTSVGKRCGREKITQAQINDRMIFSARLGLSVVRLKSGDPLIFGRLGEELDALRAAEIPFEVVPGISAGFAAAASLGLSLTDRRSSSRVTIVSAHRARDGKRPPETDWSGLAHENATLMVYMPGPDLSQLSRQLLDAGLDPSTPCVVVSRATTPGQQEIRAALGDLHLVPHVASPSIILIGEVLDSAAGTPRPELTGYRARLLQGSEESMDLAAR